jgi:hypothetical protein
MDGFSPVVSGLEHINIYDVDLLPINMRKQISPDCFRDAAKQYTSAISINE